jgi:hypothetical protein
MATWATAGRAPLNTRLPRGWDGDAGAVSEGVETGAMSCSGNDKDGRGQPGPALLVSQASRPVAAANIANAVAARRFRPSEDRRP